MLKVIKSVFCMLILSLSMGSAVFASDTEVGSDIDVTSPAIELAGQCSNGSYNSSC